MKMRNQYIRLASTLAIAGLVASQIPSRPSVAVADSYAPPDLDAEQLAVRAGGLVLLAGFANAGAAGVGGGPGGFPVGREEGNIASLLRRLASPSGISDFSDIYFNSGLQTVSGEKDLGLAGVHQRTIGATEASVAQEARTVFAPTNESLNMVLGAERVAKLKQPSYQAQARALVASLTFQGRYTISRVKDLAARGQSLLMFSGDSMTPNIGWGELMLSEHPATDGMVIITNGVFDQN